MKTNCQSLFIVFFLLIGSATISIAQINTNLTGKLTGKIYDDQNKPVGYATVVLLKTDGSAVNGSLTKENGAFSIEHTGAGKFRLRVSGIGIEEKTFNDIIIAQDEEKNIGTFTVRRGAIELKGANVVGDRPLMELSVDKKTFNVEKNITSSGGSAADVLQNVPSVSVDPDGNISLRGKSGVTLLIDGKPASLLGSDAASALQSLPASSVQSVEVITNPSAKYDAQGMSGIVNIITKRDTKFGMNGSASAGIGTRDKYNGSININLRNKKWNLFANSNFRLNHNYNRTTTDRNNNFNDSSYHSYEDAKRSFLGWFTTAGAEYTLDNKNSFTLTENLNVMNFSHNGASDFSIFDNDSRIALQHRDYKTYVNPHSISSSLDFKHKFKEKQELTTNITYARMDAGRTQRYETRNFDGHETLMSGPIVQTSPGDGSSDTWNAQADFTTPFLGKNGKLDLGAKSQLFHLETQAHPQISITGSSPVTDSTLLSNYSYDQNVHAGYINYSNIAGKFSYQLGLRSEYATYDGITNSFHGKKYNNDFFDFFPSAFISYQLPRQQSVYASYTRRINRPFFLQLIPYVDLSDPQDTSTGNPDLKPEYINNTELSYSRQFQKGHMLLLSVYYQYTQNMIERYKVFYPSGTTFSQPRNLNSGITYGLEFTGRAQILPIWDATANLNFFENKVNGNNVDSTVSNQGFSWFGKINSNLRLPAGFSLQLNGNYEGPKPAAQSQQSDSWWIDAALKKNFLNNKLSLVLNVSDIFNTHKYTTTYDQQAYYQTIYRDRETRIANLTLTWRFGKSESKNGYRRRAQGNMQPTEKERGENLKKDDEGDAGGY